MSHVCVNFHSTFHCQVFATYYLVNRYISYGLQTRSTVSMKNCFTNFPILISRVSVLLFIVFKFLLQFCAYNNA